MNSSKISGSKNLLIVSQLFEFAVKTKTQFFRKKYPDASEDELKRLTLESIERGTR
jgi:hypothetical protein